MRDLKSFRKKVEGYYKQKNNKDGLRYTQRELAEEIGINKDELSKRLNSYEDPKTRRTWQLTDDDVLAIVRTLAKWSAITSQEQAIELLKMMTYPHISSIDWKAEPLSYLRPLPARFTHLPSSIDRNTDRQRQEERLFRLHAIRVDHRGFLRNRLESFVGRERELAEIRQLIDATLPAGGYITITGQAGQGKSSIIAKLVQEYIPEKTAHHFIPLNPGPGYQVSVLLDLLSLLVLKHDLSDLYVASESQATLQVYLSKVLNELAEKGQHEVIFIDGLDQLKEDVDGERDLSFLPASLPRGMVFVLGTRPNDTLRPLELRKPYRQYQLPNLSKHDFELILKH